MTTRLSSINFKNTPNIGFSSNKKKKPQTQDAASGLKPSNRSLQGEMRNLCRSNPQLLDQLTAICNLPEKQQAEAFKKLQAKLNPPSNLPKTTAPTNYHPVTPGTKPQKSSKVAHPTVNSSRAKKRAQRVALAAKITGKPTEEISKLSNAELDQLLKNQPKRASRSPVIHQPEEPGIDTIAAQYGIDLGYQAPRPIPTFEQVPKGQQAIARTTTIPSTGQVVVSNMVVPDQRTGVKQINREITRANPSISIPQNIQLIASQLIADRNNLIVIQSTQANNPTTISAFQSVVRNREQELKRALQAAGLKFRQHLIFNFTFVLLKQ